MLRRKFASLINQAVAHAAPATAPAPAAAGSVATVHAGMPVLGRRQSERILVYDSGWVSTGLEQGLAQVLDLSAGGALVACNIEIAPYTPVTLTVQLDREGQEALGVEHVHFSLHLVGKHDPFAANVFRFRYALALDDLQRAYLAFAATRTTRRSRPLPGEQRFAA